MKKNKIGVLGASGRMGQEISKCLEGQTRFEAFLGWSRKNISTGYKNNVTKLDLDLMEKVDLWIDFSTPEALMNVLPKLIRLKKPLVTGTTGLSDAQMKKLKAASQQIPVMWSSNMSVGIAVLMKAMESLQALPAFDFQIEETHHKHKKDSPSGTAMLLQKKLEKVIQRSAPAPLSLRGGGVIGNHKVWALGSEEILCFEHNALQRSVFARGAVWAAEKMMKKSKGFYSFGDLLR